MSQMKFPAHLVLTVRNRAAGELNDIWRFLEQSFAKLRHRREYRKLRGICGRGYTWNGEKQTWHGHLHIVIDSVWLNADRLRAAWETITRGEGLSPNITRVTDPHWAAVEIVAGTRKGGRSDLERIRVLEDTNLIDELVESLDGKKMQWSFGGLKIAKLEKEKAICHCPRCGVKYDRREWVTSTVDKSEVSDLEFGARWKDFFNGFKIRDGTS